MIYTLQSDEPVCAVLSYYWIKLGPGFGFEDHRVSNLHTFIALLIDCQLRLIHNRPIR